MKIDPSSTSTTLDYGENPNKDSGEQDKGTGSDSDGYQPIVPHDEGSREAERKLRERKARKKKEKRKKRKLAERKTRQEKDQDL